MVYSRDHPPPHVHVVGPRGSAKILIAGPAGRPALVWNQGLTRRDLEQALAAIDDHHQLLLDEWNRIHDRTQVDRR